MLLVLGEGGDYREREAGGEKRIGRREVTKGIKARKKRIRGNVTEDDMIERVIGRGR